MRTRKYLSSSGHEILVGQDDESNDQLSLKVAHPNDLWFHVSGFPGSHVVLRCGAAGTEPDKTSVREAAALAAWFSRMRNAGKVPVNYCPAKFVTKPRGAKAGTVAIARARKLTVRPHLLQSELRD